MNTADELVRLWQDHANTMFPLSEPILLWREASGVVYILRKGWGPRFLIQLSTIETAIGITATSI